MTDRALFILPSTGDPVAVRQVDWQAESLRQSGSQVSVCSLGPARAQPQADQAIERQRDWDISAAWRLRQHINQFRPQTIHLASSDANVFVALASWGFEKQLVLQRPSSLPGWIDRMLATPSQLIVSTQTERNALVQLGIDPCRVHCAAPVVHWGTAASISRCELTSQLDIPLESKLLGIVAPLLSLERLRDVIWVGDLLKVLRDDTHVLIFGDGPERLRLERFRRRVEIEDRVHFLGMPADLHAWLAHLDCYWCAAASDSITGVMIDMMRAGTPLILSDTAGHRELVQHEQNGLLFPPGKLAHFARQTLRVIEESALRNELTTRARTTWEERYRPERVLDQWLAIHERLCKNTRGRIDRKLNAPKRPWIRTSAKRNDGPARSETNC